jgi:hypothetical protein
LAGLSKHDDSTPARDSLLGVLEAIAETAPRVLLDIQAVHTASGHDQVAAGRVVGRAAWYAVVRELAVDLPAGRARARHPVDGVGRSKLATVAAMTRLVLQVRTAPGVRRKKQCGRQEDGKTCDESLYQVSASRRLDEDVGFSTAYLEVIGYGFKIPRAKKLKRT